MKIANVMISRVNGGIEYMFLHYNTALSLSGNQIMSVIDRKCQLKPAIKTPYIEINFNKYNPLLIFKLYFALKNFEPDIIIVHQKKAIPLFKIVARLLGAKIVGVAHNPKVKRLEKCDAVISITYNQKEKMIAKGLEQSKIFAVPNMVESPKNSILYQPFHQPVVIGTMGRFDPAKGFGEFIKALSVLKQNNIAFKALIGGKNNSTYNEEEERIFQLVKDLDLQNEVEFCGWVSDKAKFFNSIDIFVFPSLEEAFGIVLLEAALAKKPIVSSTADGPKEVFANTNAAFMFEKGNTQMLAEKLQELIKKPDYARKLADNAYNLIMEKYTINAGAKLLNAVLQKIMENKK